MTLFYDYDSSVENGIQPIDSFHQIFYEEMSEDDFNNWIKNIMVTESGKQFREGIKNDENSKMLENTYFSQIQDEYFQYIVENLAVQIMA